MRESFNNEISNLINRLKHSKDIFSQKQLFNEFKSMLKDESYGNLSEYYLQSLCDKKSKGVVYTPLELSQLIIKKTIKTRDIVNNPFIKILDPSCGTGNFILEIYRYLYKVYLDNLELINKTHGLNLEEKTVKDHIISNNLYGYDIDENALNILKLRLWEESELFYERNFKLLDFLIEEDLREFDIIIGNPPYIGHKNIDREYVSKIKNLYEDIYKDKSDILYCFFIKAFGKVKEGGKVSLITSRYILESKSGEYIRNFIYNNYEIKEIIDFYGYRPFKNIGIDPVIFFLEKNKSENQRVMVIKPKIEQSLDNNKFNNKNYLEGFRKFSIDLNKKDNIWILIDEKEKLILNKIEKKCHKALGEVVNTFQGIITGCDKAFVVTADIVKAKGIESQLVKPWIKSSNVGRSQISFNNLYIIYSDEINKEEDFPYAIGHIRDYKDKLEKRRECEKGLRPWYKLQWGRNKEVFEGEKIIFPYKASSNRFAIDRNSYFSADIYAMKLRDHNISYNYLEGILNTDIYEYYCKLSLKKLGRDLYEYYPNKLLNIKIPIIDMNRDYEKELIKLFDLTQEELEVIKSYNKK